MNRAAEISACGLYRYSLRRWWDLALPMLCVVMLNPSTADALLDDPTIRRCVEFAKREGFGGIIVVNAFAFRATDPKALQAAADPVGPKNDDAIVAAVRGCGAVLAAWGASYPRRLRHRIDRVHRALLEIRSKPVQCLGVTADGCPRHPLYVRGDAPLERLLAF